jgi:hypothetical protein
MTHSTAKVKKLPYEDGENLEVLEDSCFGNFFAKANCDYLNVFYIAVRTGLHLLLQHQLPAKQIQ